MRGRGWVIGSRELRAGSGATGVVIASAAKQSQRVQAALPRLPRPSASQ
jgi:hypothetical protein